MSNTFMHNHDRVHRKRDTLKCYNQKEETRKRDRKTGLSTIKYNISSRKELTIDGVRVTILNVNLECDKNLTPWCDCTDAQPKEKQRKIKRWWRTWIVITKCLFLTFFMYNFLVTIVIFFYSINIFVCHNLLLIWSLKCSLNFWLMSCVVIHKSWHALEIQKLINFI